MSKNHRKRTYLPLIAACLALLFGAPMFANQGQDVDLSTQYDSLDSTLLDFTIKGFDQETVFINGREHMAVSMCGAGLVDMGNAGHPQLPVLCNSLLIPDSARMKATVLSSEYYELEGVNVAPYKGVITRDVDPATVPYTFGELYETDAMFPGKIASLRDPYIMHDVRGIVVEVFPLQYNPVTKVLRVYTNIQVEVAAAGAGDVNIIDRSSNIDRTSISFESLYSGHFANYKGNRSSQWANTLGASRTGGRGDPPPEDGDMLIISYGSFMSAMQPLVNWKNSTGIGTTIVDVSSIGNNSTSIKNHIKSVYNSSNLSFVLLVGDAAQVTPGSYGSGASDAFYSTISADTYPDIFVGRFSAQNTSQVDTQVERTVTYEQEGHDLSMGGWNTCGMGIASSQGAGAGHYGEADYVHVGLIRDELLAYGFTMVDEIYDTNGGNKTQVTNGLNQGRRTVNYCGHGSTTSWGTTGFSNTDVNNLTNDGMLPFICSVACVNGNFTSGTCFGEAWLQATHNGNPTGAIGCYMSSVNQSWAPPMYGQGNHCKSGKYGAADRFWNEMNWSLGGCLYGGSCCMMDLAGSSGVQEFMNWIVFGDPSLRLFSEPSIMLGLETYVPDVANPGLALSLEVEILNGGENYVPGSGKMYYRYDGGGFIQQSLIPLGGNLHGAELPNTVPGDEPEFYFSAEGDGGTTVYLPATAPADVYSYEVCFIQTLWEDNFETNTGWTVQNDGSLTSGAWERGVPVGGGDRGDPATDQDGSGKCFLTENVDGDSDVDGGPTILISPVLDLSSGDAEISYFRWHNNDDNDDWFTVQISEDNGASWRNVEQVKHTSGWNFYGFMASDHVVPNNQIKMRFQSTDNPNNSVTESGLDAFKIRRIDYDPSLWADNYTLLASTGGTVGFSLDAGASNGNRKYLLLGSVTGTSPGLPLPGGQVLPIEWDILTNIIMMSLYGSPVFVDFTGTVNGAGQANATLDTLGPLDPGMIGIDIYFAYLLTKNPFYASNFMTLHIDP